MTFLDVPFREKDQAKQLGARWDAASKKWYVPSELTEDLSPFQKWLPVDSMSNSMPTDTVVEHDRGGVFSSAFVEKEGGEKNKGIELSTLLRNVQNALRQKFPGAVWVIAEIANLNIRRGHVYLELTQSNAQGQTIANCRAMIWQRQATGLLQRFETETGAALAIGQKVLFLAEMNFHEQYGFSMVIQDIDSSYTLGALEQKLIELRKQLISKGLYQQNKQFILPNDFFRVAVIAPPDAAGLGDFRADADALQAKGLCDFSYFYSAFQGELVSKEMNVAFQAVHSQHQSTPFDCLVVIRGGGAKLDLHMLNIYALAQLLCEAALPVITGIGHERDSTILDEVANQCFDTPSKVIGHIRQQIFQQAQLAQANWKTIEHTSLLSVQQLKQTLQHLNQSITYGSQRALYLWKQKIDPLNTDIKRLSSGYLQQENRRLSELKISLDMQLKSSISLKKQLLEQVYNKSQEGAGRVISYHRQQISQWIALILSSGPKTQLSRGFNIAKHPNTHKPITSAVEALSTETLLLEFMDGQVSAIIDREKGLLNPTISNT